eukprot:CAMPEP_0114587600 /NCGR_PEP_ID=MMETSP0125-20121206/10527_1 /TAXON_ID=485358 ORGANISM="Aristerostoma sp., Strain ATCC 50986" /NCGR_SAMPLE_ID=MMETSP0125 /ASSEMBLY_ACC=CAM_ASM_000245 /LENGTH=54 /DNA_ID=CAMNT_0001783607 /DNA_START=850 /DNA_END=1014 /DNA_ORIENTATION=-
MGLIKTSDWKFIKETLKITNLPNWRRAVTGLKQVKTDDVLNMFNDLTKSNLLVV